MTQSAVSHAVRGLERKLGAVLFERLPSGARRTPAGDRATTHARRILRLYEVMAAEVHGTDDGLTGPLRVAAFRSAALHLLSAALERLASRHPGLRPEVRVIRDVGRGTAGEVADGRADLAIVTLGGSTPMPDGLLTGTLLEEAYSFVHPNGHPDPRGLPLVDAPANVTVADLGPGRPARTVGYATTPELARTAAVRALIRELRTR